MAIEERTISMLVNNQPGVLSRIAGVFSSRGYNIRSLCVAETINPEVSRITLTSRAESDFTEKIKKQLDKLVNVISVEDFGESDYVDRELVLIRVKADAKARAEIMQICDIFRAKIIDVTPRSYTIETTGSPVKINAILELLRPLGLKELVRTGPVAIGRGAKGWKG